MSQTDKKRDDLECTEELFAFLQGTVPDGYSLKEEHVPGLTPDQAWSVIWYLGNLLWQVTDHIERCDVCGSLYDANGEGGCLDYGDAPYHFCGGCEFSEAYETKRESRDGQENP